MTVEDWELSGMPPPNLAEMWNAERVRIESAQDFTAAMLHIAQAVTQPAAATPDAVNSMVASFLTPDQLAAQPDPVPLIAGLIDIGHFALLYGAPGTMKSFVAIDMLAHIANGLPWQGRAVTRTSALYVAAEGGGGAKKRFGAWSAHHGRAHGVLVRREPINLYEGTEIDVMISALVRSGIGVVCFDTLNRSAVGMDENSAKDMGFVLRHVGKLTAAGITTILVHHTPREGSNPRGSTALEGATDHGLRIEKHGSAIELRNERQKDHEQGAPIRLSAQPVPQADSLVIVPATGAQIATTREDRLEAAVLGFLADNGPSTRTAVKNAPLGVGSKPDRVDMLELARNRGLVDAVGNVPSNAKVSGADLLAITDAGRARLLELTTTPAEDRMDGWGTS